MDRTVREENKRKNIIRKKYNISKVQCCIIMRWDGKFTLHLIGTQIPYEFGLGVIKATKMFLLQRP